jgi:ribonuclease-3
MAFSFFRRLFKSRRLNSESMAQLERVLEYRFRDSGHLLMALSHRSYVNTLSPRPPSNERLEFLGDAILNAIVTDYLFRRYPECEEGQLSQMKSLVVSAKVLDLCAAQWNLGEFILLSKAEEKSGGRKRPSILADAYEAVLGAVFLDGSYPAVTRLVNATLFQIMDDVLADEDLANYKSLLLEFTQSQGFGVPNYEVVRASGPEHRKAFVVAVKVQGREWGRGSGASKKVAEQSGARAALETHGGRLVSGGSETEHP